MLSGLQRLFGHREMLGVGRADIYCINGRIAKQFSVIAGSFGNRERRSEARSCIIIPAKNSSGFHRLDALHRFQVHAAHKSGPENCSSDCFHLSFFLDSFG